MLRASFATTEGAPRSGNIVVQGTVLMYVDCTDVDELKEGFEVLIDEL